MVNRVTCCLTPQGLCSPRSLNGRLIPWRRRHQLSPKVGIHQITRCHVLEDLRWYCRWNRKSRGQYTCFLAEVSHILQHTNCHIKTVKVIGTDGSTDRRVKQRNCWRCSSAGMLARVKCPSGSSIPTSSDWSGTSAKWLALTELWNISFLCGSWREFVQR